MGDNSDRSSRNDVNKNLSKITRMRLLQLITVFTLKIGKKASRKNCHSIRDLVWAKPKTKRNIGTALEKTIRIAWKFWVQNRNTPRTICIKNRHMYCRPKCTGQNSIRKGKDVKFDYESKRSVINDEEHAKDFLPRVEIKEPKEREKWNGKTISKYQIQAYFVEIAP